MQQPRADAQVLAQLLHVRDQVRGGVDRQAGVRVAGVRRAAPAAALVEQHDPVALRVEAAAHVRHGALAGAAVQEHGGLAAGVAGGFPVDEVPVADVQHPLVVRLDRRIQLDHDRFVLPGSLSAGGPGRHPRCPLPAAAIRLAAAAPGRRAPVLRDRLIGLGPELGEPVSTPPRTVAKDVTKCASPPSSASTRVQDTARSPAATRSSTVARQRPGYSSFSRTKAPAPSISSPVARYLVCRPGASSRPSPAQSRWSIRSQTSRRVCSALSLMAVACLAPRTLRAAAVCQPPCLSAGAGCQPGLPSWPP